MDRCRRQPLPGAGPARALRLAALFALILGGLPAHAFAECAYRVLGAAERNELEEDARPMLLERPGPYQLEVVKIALNFVPPLLCKAVGRVVFVTNPAEEAIAYTKTVAAINRGRPADLIYFNNAAMPENLLAPAPVVIDGQEEDANIVNQLNAIYAVIHEATHVADHMLDSQRTAEGGWFDESAPDPAKFPDEGLEVAAETVSRNLLYKGFRREWVRMHDAFVAAGMAREYYGKEGGQDLKAVDKLEFQRNLQGAIIYDEDGNPVQAPAKDRYGRPAKVQPAPIELSAAGFMTHYGGTMPAEDIAEFTAAVLMRQYLDEIGASGVLPEYDVTANDHACGHLQAAETPSISPQQAALYSKLGFLRSVGFITQSAYKHCVGQLAIRGDGEGFYTFRSGQQSRHYGGDPKHGMGRRQDDGPIYYTLTAEGTAGASGEEVPVRVELMINVSPPEGLVNEFLGRSSYADLEHRDVSFPRGVYFVGDRHGGKHRLLIRKTSDGGVLMDVSQGAMLVGRGSSELVEGSVFVQRRYNFAGGLMSSIAGDEPVKEPTSITFRYQAGGPDCVPGMTDCAIP